MNRVALLLSLLGLSLPALADDKFLCTITAASGGSANSRAVGSKLPDGTTGPCTLPASNGVQNRLKIAVQCDAAARVNQGRGASTAASNTPPNKGVKIDADMLYSFSLMGSDTVAVIAADGSSTVHCDVFQRSE